MTGRLASLLLVVAVSTGSAQPVAPRETDDRTREAARDYFDRGDALHRAGEHARAIAVFEAGWRAEGDPDFLYSIAQVYRELGDCTNAVAQYKAFIATRPSDEKVNYARINIERCPLQPGEPPRRRAWYLDPVGGVLAAAGASGLLLGTVYLLRAESTVREADSAGTLMAYEEVSDRARGQRRTGTIVLVAGGVLGAAAAVRYVLVSRGAREDARRRPARAVSVSPGPGAVLVSWGGAF